MLEEKLEDIIISVEQQITLVKLKLKATKKELKQIQVEGINLNREFNFIYLKSSLQKEKYLNLKKSLYAHYLHG